MFPSLRMESILQVLAHSCEVVLQRGSVPFHPLLFRDVLIIQFHVFSEPRKRLNACFLADKYRLILRTIGPACFICPCEFLFQCYYLNTLLAEM